MNPVIEAVRQKYPGAYDDLSDDDLTRAIAAKTEGAYMDVPGFKSDFDRLTAPKLTPSLPEPGQQQMGGQPVPEGPTQAFPTGAQDAAARAKIPPMSLAEAGELAMTPFASLPRVGKPGGVARGVSEIVDSAIEQTLLTPASGPLGVAFQVPGLRQALTATIAASLTKAAAQKAGEASVTKSPQTITEAVGLGLMGAAGARDLLPRAAAEAAKVPPKLATTPTESEVPDASRYQEAGEVHAPVPVQPGESARTVPVEEGGPRVLTPSLEEAKEVAPTPAKEVTPSETKTKEEGQKVLEQPASVSVPVMVTRKMRRDLSKLGYSQSEIDAMRPEEAYSILNPPPPTFETITPAQDTAIGENAAGEKLYERSDGSIYRMRNDRKDRPNGYPDFGGDLAPISKPATVESEQAPPSAAPATAAVSEAKPPGVAAPEAPSATTEVTPLEPLTQPETITAAAWRDPETGTVHTGTYHIKIYSDLNWPDWKRPRPEDEGFVTSTGRFVGRDEATAIALKAKQVEARNLTTPEGGITAQELGHFGDKDIPIPRAGMEVQKQAQPGGTETPAAQVERPGATEDLYAPAKNWVKQQSDALRGFVLSRMDAYDRWKAAKGKAKQQAKVVLDNFDRELEQAKQVHHDAVEQAYNEGKPVPPDVLKDYPDLANLMPTKALSPAPVAAKVQAEVSRVARTEGTRPAKEIKNELVDRLEKAAAEAPFNTDDYFPGLYVYEARTLSETTRLTDRPVEGTRPLKDWLEARVTRKDKTPNRDTIMGAKFIEEALQRKGVSKVTIDIPGDGTFTVWNTKDALGKVLARAKKVSTSTAAPKTFTESVPTKEQGRLFAKEAEQPPLAPVSKGPGAAASGEPGTYSAIKQLSDQMETAPAKTVQDGLRLRERMADKVADFKDAATRILARARAIPATLKQLSSGVRTFNDVDRRIGELDYALQRSAGLSREAGDAIAKGIKNDAMRDATAIWIDAKGDEAAIRDTLANLPEGTTPRVRRALEAALNLPEDVKTKASEISQYFQVREEEAIAEGIFDQGLEDYYTHIWKRRENMPGSVLSALNSGRINEYFKFARQRKIPTFLEGIQQGKEPLLDPAKVVPYYNYLLDRAIASRKFVKSLEEVNAADGRPVLAAVGTRSVIKEGDVPKATLIKLRVAPEGASDYRSIDHPALRKWKWAAMDENGAPVFYEGDLRVHPDHFERLANMMDRSRLNPSNLARLALRASTEVKGFKLGVASFFHPIQVGTHALFHWTSPIVRGDIDWEAPATKFAIEKGGLQIAPDPRAIAEFSEGILTPGLIHQVPIIGPLSRALSEWTFADYIPKLKLQTFETVLARDKVRYKGKLSDEQIAQRAGDAVNNAFGELNRLWLGKYGRDPRFQRFLRGIFLAPDFGEARLRFVSKAATRFGGEERLALATAGIGLFLAARVGNMLSHGDPELEDWHHWFDVKTGNRWFGVRSIVGDISHLITKPRQFWEVRLNPLYSRTALAALSGRNPSGHKFAGVTDFAADIGKQFVPIHLGALTRDDQRLWESFLGAMGAQSWKASATAEIHRVARDWRAKRGIKDNTEILAGADSPYRKARLALEFQDRQKFHEAIGELVKQRQAAGDRTPRKTIETNFRRYYHMPFAGNARLEGDFRRSLNERDRRLYQDAKKERDALWNQFQAWY